MKGVVLAGGEGSRLHPLTLVANKHLLPVYNKTMVQHPIETLQHLGIDDILIVTGGDKVGKFADFLGDGAAFGAKFTYKVQMESGGIAHALALAKDFVGDEHVSVILGDNIFDYSNMIMPKISKNAVIYVKEVKDPERFGVVGYDSKGVPNRIIEKPKNPPSNDVVVGLYIYPPDVFDVIKGLKPSARGELEITDVNNFYLKEKRLNIERFKGFWSDAGTFDSLFEASQWAYWTDINKR